MNPNLHLASRYRRVNGRFTPEVSVHMYPRGSQRRPHAIHIKNTSLGTVFGWSKDL